MAQTPPQSNTTGNNFSALERAQIEIERRKSHDYRALYSQLLEEHKGVLEEAWKGSTDTEESRLIQTMWISERNSLALGFLVGCATLTAIRFGTPMFVRRIGGEEKILQMQKRDEEAKKMGTYKFQRAVAWVVEGGFSFWVGSRAYNYQAKQSEGAYNTVAKIPLCAGKSVIANGFCEEWVNLTTKQVPKAFWKNLQMKDALNDERTWKAIATFSNNCIKRRAYERKLTNVATEGKENMEAPTSLSASVPDDVPLSELEAAMLVEDGPL